MSEKVADFRKRKLVFIDLETTGLDPEIHEIVEVACLVVDGETFNIISEYEAKVKPQHLEVAYPEALRIIGYSEKEWRDARPASQVLKEVAKLAPGGMITGWNVSFDWWFLQKGFKRFGIKSKFDYHKIDVMSIAYAMLYPRREIKEWGLHDIAPFLGLRIVKEHRAMADIRLTHEIFKKLMKEK